MEAHARGHSRVPLGREAVRKRVGFPGAVHGLGGEEGHKTRDTEAM